MESHVDKKYNIAKIRLMNLLEEHTDALALAQGYKEELENAKKKISFLEKELEKRNAQEKEPTVTIVSEPVDTSE